AHAGSLTSGALEGPVSHPVVPVIAGLGQIVKQRWQASAYHPVVAHRVLRRLLPALRCRRWGTG
ncbi:MAG TPA: hypothetical protein VIV12_18965, partial [Streptosporangiaceae bacterium]